MHDQAHSFSMVFFVLTFRTLCSRDYRMSQAVGNLCAQTHCTNLAQATGEVVWLCSGSLWPLPLWREAGGWVFSSNSNGDNLLFSIIFPLSSWRLLKDGCSLLSVWLL